MPEKWSVELTLDELKCVEDHLFDNQSLGPVGLSALKVIQEAVKTGMNWQRSNEEPLPSTPSRGEFEDGGGN